MLIFVYKEFYIVIVALFPVCENCQVPRMHALKLLAHDALPVYLTMHGHFAGDLQMHSTICFNCLTFEWVASNQLKFPTLAVCSS